MVRVVEDVTDAATGSFDNLAGAFGGADSGVLGSMAGTFADVLGTLDGVEGDDVSGALAGAFGDIACGSSGAFADVAGTVADVTTGAGGLGLSGWWRLLLLSVRGRGERDCGGGEKGEDDAAGVSTHGRASLELDARAEVDASRDTRVGVVTL
jgi:hypothetical protein